MTRTPPAPDTQHDDLSFWHHLGELAIAESNGVTSLLRGAHRPTEGAIRESIVRRFLRRALPSRYGVSTGFVRWHGLMSRQLDVLVWDRHSHAPIYEDGDLVVVEPAACVAVAEVKTTLTRTTLGQALDVLHFPAWENSPNLPVRSPIRAVFAFRAPRQSTKSVAFGLAEFYRRALATRGHRLCMRARPPARIRMAADPIHRIGDFERPRFVELVDVVCVIDLGFTFSQGFVYNDDPTFPGDDPIIVSSTHNEPGRALAEGGAIIAELLGRSDPRSDALGRRRRLAGSREYWLLGAAPTGDYADLHLNPTGDPLWTRPFGQGPVWGRDWPITYGKPRSAMVVNCGNSGGCAATAESARLAKRSGWHGVPLSDAEADTLWFCPAHKADFDVLAIVQGMTTLLAR